ncbi:DHA2 family efflux MFS transporter permease subunit [Gracilibacillus salitolerans]|uniref:DHA2 family efflux MFS transporter permease subunit n=1 Tax=Gracilibacillus salitolerans TaxID=2663022 RepID=A0A5Q2TFL8_9BACI|nr:MDR family MFS transporter [Gracilibacillus salitolerans]QGH33007.1 DHA2 family efflux MFS transporter permease subunit [Gracilibacillus salitolerans]
MTTSVQKRGTIVALLLAGAFIAILNQTLMITAIPPIMNEMGITANSAQWLTTIFMLVNGIMIPISAFLIDRFTTRQLFITAMSVFAVGTLVAALAPNFTMLLAGRVIQSAGAGVMLPLMQTVFLMIFPVNKRGSIMGLVGLVISFAPAIGPSLSGWITDQFSWRVLFYIILPIAIIDIVIAYFVMKNVTEISKPKLDIPSIILSSFGFGGLLYGFTSAGNNGWSSPVTIVVLTVGVISLLWFILRQLKLTHPMLEFRVFTYSIFPLTVTLGMIAFMGLIAVETLVPLYMQDSREFSAVQSGLVILPGALITGIMSPITGRIFDKVGARWLAIIGFSLMTIGSFLFTILDDKTSITYLTVVFAIRMLGISMVMMPAATAGLNQLPKKLIAHGAAMDNTLRNVSASVGTAIIVTVLTQAESIAEQSGDLYPGIAGANMAFLVLSIITLIGLILSFFIKKSRPYEEEGD